MIVIMMMIVIIDYDGGLCHYVMWGLLPGQNAALAPAAELHKHKYRRSRVLKKQKLCQDDDKAMRDF